MERAVHPGGSYRIRELPPPLACRLQRLLRLPRMPATLGEMVHGLASRSGHLPRFALCCEESRHRVNVAGETIATRCVMDALLLAAAAREGGRVESLSPLSGQKVSLRVSSDGTALLSPPTAVFSYGAVRNGDHIYEAVCPYLLAFASADEYEEWARRTPEALTIVLTPEDALALARDLAARLLQEVEG